MMHKLKIKNAKLKINEFQNFEFLILNFEFSLSELWTFMY